MASRNPKSPIDDIIKLFAKEGIKISKKTASEIKRYARGIGRADYLDRKPAPMKLKTPAQKKVKSRLEMIEDRRQDKGARLWGDNTGPTSGYFVKDKLNRQQKKVFNQGFAAEQKIGAANARTARRVASAKKSPVKKTAAKKR